VSDTPCILFTAFEPSGDEHAASAITVLRQRLPDVPIYGLGGKKMAEAGCQLIEETAAVGRMGSDSAWQVFDHFKRLSRVKKWARGKSIAVHVPTDSPAANWSYCRMIKRMYRKPGADRVKSRVVHLVAPQVWAWAQWRVKRLRKWSDLALCLLPFEPAWFRARGVNARFIGHPAFDHQLDTDKLSWESMKFPKGSPKIALLPGSRSTELTRNWPILHSVFTQLLQQHPDAQAVVGAVDANAEKTLRELTPDSPDSMHYTHGRTDAAIHWADVVLTVSGTVTLHIARHTKPMVILYKVSPFIWSAFGQFIVDTRTFTLPNLITLGRPAPTREGHLFKEFIPFWGDDEPIVREMSRLISDEKLQAQQVEALEAIVEKFSNLHAGREAGEQIAAQYEAAVGES